MNPNLRNRYLSLLRLRRRAPSLQYLQELVQAHVQRIPFENISKLYYRKALNLRTIPSLEQYLDGIEHFNFGGTCYTNNYYFYLLLSDLGFQSMLCGADMTNPDVHMVSFVEVEGCHYLVDVGYAAPFMVPIPRDLEKDFSIVLGRDCYVLRPQDPLGRSRMDMYRNGNLRHGYLAKPGARKISDFEPAIRASFRDVATFMNTILLARFFTNRSVVFHNLTLIESQGEHFTIQTLESRSELIRAIDTYFGIPTEVSKDVIKDLDLTGNAWN